jgi:hypothetical protein
MAGRKHPDSKQRFPLFASVWTELMQILCTAEERICDLQNKSPRLRERYGQTRNSYDVFLY